MMSVMASESLSRAKQAQEVLRDALIKLFGPQLVGINSFGAGLDHVTHELSLRVMVDGPSSARKADKLPKEIDGLRVRITQGGPARAD